MRIRPSQSIIRTLFMTTLLLSPSCVLRRAGPDPSVDVTVVVEPCADLELTVRALELDGDLHVHGQVRVTGVQSGVRGHVDVFVRSPDGAEWAHDRATYHPRLRSSSHGGPLRSVFDTTFDGRPPDGSTITIRHHAEAHGAEWPRSELD
jgi:hypothetical protein